MDLKRYLSLSGNEINAMRRQPIGAEAHNIIINDKADNIIANISIIRNKLIDTELPTTINVIGRMNVVTTVKNLYDWLFVLRLVKTSYNLSIQDDSANILNALGTTLKQLYTKIDNIYLKAGQTGFVVSVDQLNSNVMDKVKIAGSSSKVTLYVEDTSTNIANNIDFLQSKINIKKITLTDNAPLAINVAQLKNDVNILSKISNGHPALAITDKSANINIDNLLTNSKIVSIALTDKPALAIALSASGASITNNGAANTLVGSKLNDTLTGGVGKDTLTGGAGSDTFVFKALLDSKTNVDTITDFVSGTDKIQLPLTVFAKVGLAGALKVDDFKLSTQALDATDRIIYNASTGALSYDADGNGPTAAVQFAIVGVSTHPTLVNTDFVIA